MKSNQVGGSDTGHRRPQHAARSQRRLLGGRGGVALGRVDLHPLLALRDDQSPRTREHAAQVVRAEALLARIDLLLDLDVVLTDELIGTPTARSAAPVVIPVDLLRHGRILSLGSVRKVLFEGSSTSQRSTTILRSRIGPPAKV